MRTRRNGLVTINSARAKYTYGRLVAFHKMSLITGGMRAQNYILRYVVVILGNEKRVLHVTRGMVGRKVEHGENMIVVINLWSLVEHEAHTLENADITH